MTGDIRIGQGFDVHAFAPERKLILCNIEIPCGFGLAGHSDADVALHAVSDAVLGALALGDIGDHFPDSDNTYKNIDSSILLEKVLSLMRERDYTIGNLDLTIMAQKPKLYDYKKLMRRRLAEICGTSPEQVSVKATTTEKLGFIGRGEGIAAEAVILLKGL